MKATGKQMANTGNPFAMVEVGDQVVVYRWRGECPMKATVVKANKVNFVVSFGENLDAVYGTAARTISKITGHVVGDSNSRMHMAYSWVDGGRVLHSWEDLDREVEEAEAAKSREAQRERLLALVRSKVGSLSNEKLEELNAWLGQG